MSTETESPTATIEELDALFDDDEERVCEIFTAPGFSIQIGRRRFGLFGKDRACGRKAFALVTVSCPTCGVVRCLTCRHHLKMARWSSVTCPTCDQAAVVSGGAGGDLL